MRCDAEGGFPRAGAAPRLAFVAGGPRPADEPGRRAALFAGLGELASALLAHADGDALRAADLGPRLGFVYVWLATGAAGDAGAHARLLEKIASALGDAPGREALASAAVLEQCRARARRLRSAADADEDEL